MISTIQAAIHPAVLPYVANAVNYAIPGAIAFTVSRIITFVAQKGFKIPVNAPAFRYAKIAAGVVGLIASISVIRYLKFAPILNLTGTQFAALFSLILIIQYVAEKDFPKAISYPLNNILGGILCPDLWASARVVIIGLDAYNRACDGAEACDQEPAPQQL